MRELEGEKESIGESNVGCRAEAEGNRFGSRNILVKKQMAEQLKAMGFSHESVARILHLRL
jgi:hypothetical protein